MMLELHSLSSVNFTFTDSLKFILPALSEVCFTLIPPPPPEFVFQTVRIKNRKNNRIFLYCCCAQALDRNTDIYEKQNAKKYKSLEQSRADLLYYSGDED